MDDQSQLNLALICLAISFHVLSVSVCTTRHWQASGRLVQELNICNVGLLPQRSITAQHLAYINRMGDGYFSNLKDFCTFEIITRTYFSLGIDILLFKNISHVRRK